jgi:hypothetical protein
MHANGCTFQTKKIHLTFKNCSGAVLWNRNDLLRLQRYWYRSDFGKVSVPVLSPAPTPESRQYLAQFLNKQRKKVQNLAFQC